MAEQHFDGGYRGPLVCKIVGITYRQLDYWARTDLVRPSVCDANGSGTDSAVISALQWAINNKAKYNIRVANLSLGRPITTSYKDDPLCQAVEQAGLLVVIQRVVVALATARGLDPDHPRHLTRSVVLS